MQSIITVFIAIMMILLNEFGEIIIYETEDGLTNIDVKIEDDTVWLTQQQMADLYQSSRTNVVEHIQHIYSEGELDKEATCRNFRQVRKEGNREVAREITYYNLDMIISLGYRIKSITATKFRQWATERLKEYMIKGFTMDDERLKSDTSIQFFKIVQNKLHYAAHGHTAAEVIYERADAEKTLSPVEKAYIETIKAAEKDARNASRE